MTRAWRTILALLGSAVLVVMLVQIGPSVVLDALRRAGWVILPILLLQFAVYALNALAWWLTMRPEPARPGFGAVLGISITGFALNFITPMANTGGEPYRIAALAPRLGTARATGSVLLYVMVHAVTSILLWLSAIAAALAVLDAPRGVTAALWGAGAVLLVALVVVLSGHRDGVVLRLARGLGRLRLRRLSTWLASRHETFAAVDAEIVQAWHERPAALALAIAIDLASRWLNALEFVLIASALGHALPLGTALMLWGLLALGMNLFFFFPWELGSREGTIYALVQAAQLPDSFAGLAVVLGRVREITWAAIGMVLLVLESRRRARAAPRP